MKRILNVAVLLFAFTLTTMAQTYTANPTQSKLIWIGKKVTGEHTGSIKMKEGSFDVKNDQITKGKFVIDMSSITCTDLEGEWNDKLIGHLKSDDFFGVASFPEAILVINSSSKLVDNKATIKGELTIKGTTKPIEFEATQSGNSFKANISVDRTLYNIRYGSGKFFDNLGDKTINDNFTLQVEVVATKK
ncbi:MAG: YceI family protein [Prolixibacteraceae bacterium]